MQNVISKTRALLIALPNFGQDLMRGPGGAVIQGIYAVNLGLDLATIGTILVITKIFDAVTDPLVGLLSDRYHQRHGTRKPWLVVGTLVSLVGMWFLYSPAQDAGWVYFVFSYLLMYLGWTLAEIPYAAWKAEVSHHYDSRTRVGAMDTLTGFLGSLSFSAVPILMVYLGMADKVEHSLASIHLTAILVTCLLPLLVLIALVKVPDGKPLERERRVTFRQVLYEVLRSRPVIYFVGVNLVTGLAVGMVGAVSYLYLVRYAHAADLLVYQGFAALLLLIAAVPLGAWLCRVIGKHRAWAISSALIALGVCLKDLFVDHSDPNSAHFQVSTVLVLLILSLPLVMSTTNTIAVKSLQGDLTDYGQWKFHNNLTAVYITATELANKLGMALGAFLGLMLLKVSGFDAAAGEEITRSGAWGLRLAFTWIPAALLIAVIPFLLRYPLTRKKHQTLLKALERRAARAQSAR